ncbi:hypothetical protein PMA3_25700 [Pseudomonas silesiensis]|uniref:Uncharacterized protein n=1 Tax=Pseudomonas silesiensis TaxID=1853130 RepID=A0A191YZR9_9PSED|nr:hypothetical protein PMA3_25700 [Pseudomonas silesiensis]
MPEFKAIAVATIDWCGVASELFVTLAGVGRSQFMKALQPVFMQRFAGGKHGLLQERGVASSRASKLRLPVGDA